MPDKLHICLITSGRLSESAYGGEEKFTLSYGQWLLRNLCEVTIMGSTLMGVRALNLNLLHTLPDESIHHPNEGVRALHLPYALFLLSRWVFTIMWIFKIISINSKSPIDLIHSQDTGYSGLAAVIAGKILKIPTVISSHGIRSRTIEQNLKGFMKEILLRLEQKIDSIVVNGAVRVIAVNYSTKIYLERISKREIIVLPIAIKTLKFMFSEQNRILIRKEFALTDETILLGFIGRLSREKNLELLLDAFNIVVSNDEKKIKLLIVGSGILEPDLTRYATSLGLDDKVIFTGVRRDIEKILSAIDIFILPSLTEGLPTVLLEAMATRRAILCSDIDANRELLQDHGSALFFSPYDRNDMANKMCILSEDSNLRRDLAGKAFFLSKEFDEDIVFSKILSCYKQILSLKK